MTRQDERSRQDLLAELAVARARVGALEQALAGTDRDFDNRSMLDILLLNVPDYLYFKDAQRRFVLASHHFCDLFGRGLDEIIGKVDEDLFPPEVAAQTVLDDLRVIQTGQPILCKEEGSDEIGWVLTSKLPWRDARGEIIGLFGISRDISALKRGEQARRLLESRLHHAQRLESLGVLVSGLAHDFNNLLVGVFGNLEIALLDLPEGHRARRSVLAARAAAGRSADLISQMLAYAGKGKRAFEPVELNSLVTEVHDLLKSTLPSRITLQLNLEPGPLPLRGDATQLQQILLNLITNAMEAIGAKDGEIRVETRRQALQRAALDAWRPDSALPEGDYLQLQVSDTGPGIDLALQARIFDPFFTSKATGSGLGLSAVHGIVHSHKGAIKVESQPGSGAIFTVLLPADPTASPEARPDAPAARWRGQGTVLVVDDDPVVRDVAERLVGALGFDVIAAASGEEAVARFRAQPDAVRAVLLDLRMPGMGGEATFEALHAIQPGVRVVLCSGLADAEARQRFSARGLCSTLQKPYTAALLEQALREALGEPAPGGEG